MMWFFGSVLYFLVAVLDAWKDADIWTIFWFLNGIFYMCNGIFKLKGYHSIFEFLDRNKK